MKKLILIGVTVGIASLAQANFVSGGVLVPSGTVLSGGNDYIYQETVAVGTVITGATISFSKIDLTANSNPGIKNVFYYDVVAAEQAKAITRNTVPEANYPTKQDYFTKNNLGYQIGSSLQIYRNFPLDSAQSWSTPIIGAALTLLESEFLTGTFDIGFDPNCPYNIGSITLSWTTAPGTNFKSAPDQAPTVILLGLTFVGLLAFRRKFCLN